MDNVISPNEAIDTAETTSATPSGDTKTTETPAQAGTVEQTAVSGQELNPESENYKKALQEERSRRREMQREMAQLKAEGQQRKYAGTDPDQAAAWFADPRSQELLIKVAKQELTDYTRETLSDTRYSSIPEAVKKAILKNVRGFVNETTTDPETAKVDILDYIESLLEETSAATPPVKQGFPIAATNTSAVDEAGTTPAEVQAIMDKSMTEITDDELAVLENYNKTLAKKSKK